VALAYKAQHAQEPFVMDPDQTDREIKRLLGSASQPSPTVSATEPRTTPMGPTVHVAPPAVPGQPAVKPVVPTTNAPTKL
jgi:hypothetical protein